MGALTTQNYATIGGALANGGAPLLMKEQYTKKSVQAFWFASALVLLPFLYRVFFNEDVQDEGTEEDTGFFAKLDLVVLLTATATAINGYGVYLLFKKTGMNIYTIGHAICTILMALPIFDKVSDSASGESEPENAEEATE